jgi:type I restriction enzyme S subunit
LDKYVGRLREQAIGGVIKYIKLGNLTEAKIPLPPLAEQKRIAAILDKAVEIKTKREQAIAKLDELAQSTFIEMFGDPLLNDKKHKTYRVDELCKLVRGSSPRPQGDPRYFGGSVPRLMVADLTRDGWSVTPRIDSLTEEGAKKSRPVNAGTVVMAVSGNPGLVSKLAVDACIHDGFVGFTELDEQICRPSYLLALMHMSKAAHDKNKAGAIFVNLKTDDIKAMNLPIPSMQAQFTFEKFLIKLDDVETKLRRHADLYHLSVLSLQHQAFTTGFAA